MDRVIKIKKLKEKNDDYLYWLSVSPSERLNEVENLRKEYHGENYESQYGFQKFYKVIKQK